MKENWLCIGIWTPLLSTFRRHPQAFREGGRRQPEAVSDAVRHDDRGLMLNSLDASRHATLVDMLRFSDSFRQKLALNPAEMTRYYKDECPTDPELTGRQRKYYSQIRQKIEQEMTMIGSRIQVSRYANSFPLYFLLHLLCCN